MISPPPGAALDRAEQSKQTHRDNKHRHHLRGHREDRGACLRRTAVRAVLASGLVNAVKRLAKVHGAGFTVSAVAVAGEVGPRGVGGEGFKEGACGCEERL